MPASRRGVSGSLPDRTGKLANVTERERDEIAALIDELQAEQRVIDNC
jgi:hypothetical protein